MRIAHGLQEFLLARCEVAWQIDLESDDEVAISAIGHLIALAAQAHLVAVLRFGLDLEFQFAVARLQQQFASEQCCVEVDVHDNLGIVGIVS